MNIAETISKAIKEGKWLSITYHNKEDSVTSYWIAIKDVDFDSRSFFVAMFNGNKSFNSFETWISFDRIKSASVIELTSYGDYEKVADKIERNIGRCRWLEYDKFDHNVLNYYAECNRLDNDPFQKEYSLIEGIDVRKLRKDKKFALSDDQVKRIVADIYRFDLKKSDSSFYTLAVNCFSIDDGKKKFVVCYYVLTFNPENKELIIEPSVRFNKSFLTEGRKHSLFNYINMDPDKFTAEFVDNFAYYQELIRSNLRGGEVVNTRPEIMLIERETVVDLAEIYDRIIARYNGDVLNIPLKSFFGNITRRNNVRRKEPSLILYDKKININQMRVLYNAMKYPVTFVQGPPGTGKTQTIVNVVLSAFYNGKTVLVCSSNNKPVDGIVEKLKFTYNGEKIDFPYLRLGNVGDVKKATEKIRQLYRYNSGKVVKDFLLEKIKGSNDDKNVELIKLLNNQEKRVEIEECIENSQRLIRSFKNNSSRIIEIVKKRVEQLKRELEGIPEATNEQIVSLFQPVCENHQLSQFLFFKSLQYIEKLKKPRFAELVRICNIEDPDERVGQFNLWTQNDDHIKLLTEVFPVLFSTNISSRRLGGDEFNFNLVIMDEAGQCNVATALIPMSKAESLLLVGDPNQLKPVIVLENEVNEKLKERFNVPDRYDYKKFSILDIMVESDNISKYILLKYHYRCGRKIIDFSNKRYYENKLNLQYATSDGELEVLDVKNQNVKQKNEAYDEAVAIVDYIKRNDVKDAYIITPFVNQRELINGMLRDNNIEDIQCGTIHSVQGAEKGTIIFSSALSPKTSKRTFEWIKSNYELINVAVTRAKSKLIIAVDDEVLNAMSDKSDDLYNLVQYAKSNGKVDVPENESVKIEIGKSNGSKAEDEFFETISHFCSCYRYFDRERNVKLGKLFGSDCPSGVANKEFDMVLYKKVFINRVPVVAFEVNGGEHLGNYDRERSDRIKAAICKKKGIKLVFIPNTFVKSYEYIADIILSCKTPNKPIQMTLFDEPI